MVGQLPGCMDRIRVVTAGPPCSCPLLFLTVAAPAAARRPRPTGEPTEPTVGVNVGRSSRDPLGGGDPNAVLKPPAWQGEWVRALNASTGLLCRCDLIMYANTTTMPKGPVAVTLPRPGVKAAPLIWC